MMYGFGDDQNPYTESVDFLEDIVIEFITEVVRKIRIYYIICCVHFCIFIFVKKGNCY